MRVTKLDPMSFPLYKEEKWWIVHPNNNNVEFSLPEDAITYCLEDMLDFKKGTLYKIGEGKYGWITVIGSDVICEMPQYLFARHFDAEVFVKRTQEK